MSVCTKLPKSIIKAKKRIIVIGDLHADFKMTKKLFTDLNLINNNKKWIARPLDTVVVQVGDILDGGGRGSNTEATGEMEIIDFLEYIHEQAELYNGGVYSILGNHEIMNVMGNFSYASQFDIKKDGGEEIRRLKYNNGSTLANKMSCTRNVIMKVGSFLFVHAGVLPDHINDISKKLGLSKDNKVNPNNPNNQKKFIDYLNNLMRDFLQGNKDKNNEEINKYFLDQSAILWTRNYGNDNINCDNLSQVLDYLKLGSMVIGHTPQIDGINNKCNKKLWRVDVGLSSTFSQHKKIQVLEILDDGKSNNHNNFKPFRVINL